MSDNSNQFVYNGETFTWGHVVVPARKNKDGTPKIIKATGLPSEETRYPLPEVSAVDDAVRFFRALFTSASEVDSPKDDVNPVKELFKDLLGKQFKDAYEAVVDDNGNFDDAALLAELTVVGRQSVDLDALNAEALNEAVELSKLAYFSNDPQEIAEKDAARAALGINSAEEFTLRYAVLTRKIAEIRQAMHARDVKSQERAKKMRETKAKKEAAEKATKAAAAGE